MQTPLQISFHGLPASEAVERDVRGWVAQLEHVFPRIVSCRVTIEIPHRHQQRGQLYRVQVDVGVPRSHLIAGRTTDDDPAHADVYIAIRDAFRAAKRQLESRDRRDRNDLDPGAAG